MRHNMQINFPVKLTSINKAFNSSMGKHGLWNKTHVVLPLPHHSCVTYAKLFNLSTYISHLQMRKYLCTVRIKIYEQTVCNDVHSIKFWHTVNTHKIVFLIAIIILDRALFKYPILSFKLLTEELIRIIKFVLGCNILVILGSATQCKASRLQTPDQNTCDLEVFLYVVSFPLTERQSPLQHAISLCLCRRFPSTAF